MRQKDSGRPGVMLYFDTTEPALNRMTDEQAGILFRAVMAYAHFGVLPELEREPMVALVFDTLRPKLDLDREKYDKILQSRKYAVYVREAKRAGLEPMDREEWEHQASSCDTTCDPATTTTPTPTTTPNTTATTTPNTTTTPATATAPPPAAGANPPSGAYPAPLPEDPEQRRNYFRSLFRRTETSGTHQRPVWEPSSS